MILSFTFNSLIMKKFNYLLPFLAIVVLTLTLFSCQQDEKDELHALVNPNTSGNNGNGEDTESGNIFSALCGDTTTFVNGMAVYSHGYQRDQYENVFMRSGNALYAVSGSGGFETVFEMPHTGIQNDFLSEISFSPVNDDFCVMFGDADVSNKIYTIDPSGYSQVVYETQASITSLGYSISGESIFFTLMEGVSSDYVTGLYQIWLSSEHIDTLLEKSVVGSTYEQVFADMVVNSTNDVILRSVDSLWIVRNNDTIERFGAEDLNTLSSDYEFSTISQKMQYEDEVWISMKRSGSPAVAALLNTQTLEQSAHSPITVAENGMEDIGRWNPGSIQAGVGGFWFPLLEQEQIAFYETGARNAQQYSFTELDIHLDQVETEIESGISSISNCWILPGEDCLFVSLLILDSESMIHHVLKQVDIP
jgi:hypothetical protein